MAFWLAPGEKTPAGHSACNDRDLSNHWISKKVQIGYQDQPQVIEYEAIFTLPEGEKHTFAQFEALTGYMPAEFHVFRTFDPVSKEFKPLSDGPGEQALPLVFSNEAETHAMAIFAPDPSPKGFSPVRYGRWNFKGEKVTKWNCVYRLRNEKGVPAAKYAFRLLVVVGSLEEVKKALPAVSTERGSR